MIWRVNKKSDVQATNFIEGQSWFEGPSGLLLSLIYVHFFLILSCQPQSPRKDFFPIFLMPVIVS